MLPVFFSLRVLRFGEKYPAVDKTAVGGGIKQTYSEYSSAGTLNVIKECLGDGMGAHAVAKRIWLDKARSRAGDATDRTRRLERSIDAEKGGSVLRSVASGDVADSRRRVASEAVADCRENVLRTSPDPWRERHEKGIRSPERRE